MGTVSLTAGLNVMTDYRIEFIQSTGEVIIQENGVDIYMNTMAPISYMIDKVSLNATAELWEHADSCWKDLRIESCQ
jgi:hypothetical protein